MHSIVCSFTAGTSVMKSILVVANVLEECSSNNAYAEIQMNNDEKIKDSRSNQVEIVLSVFLS